MKQNKFNKDAGRSVTNRFVADLTGIIYNTLVHSVPKNRAIREMRREIDWYATKIGGISALAAHKLWLEAYKSYNVVSKKAHLGLRNIPSDINYQEKIKSRSEVVFNAINKEIIDAGTLSKAGNWVLNEKEYDGKRQNLTEMIDLAREATKYSPFFLSDTHENCAKDHLQYESRIYYDEKYQDYVDDPRIDAYIKNHNCMSVQEVIGPPHYFLVRPNCAHVIVPVPIEEVLTSSVRKMQIRRKMIKPSHPKTEAERACRAYYKRYLEYAALWKIAPNEKLASEMKRVKSLYRKWAKLSEKGHR